MYRERFKRGSSVCSGSAGDRYEGLCTERDLNEEVLTADNGR